MKHTRTRFTKTLLLTLFAFGLVLTTKAQDEKPPECVNLESIHKKIGYPVEAKAARVEGKVIAKVVVSARGRVESHEIVESPNDILSDAVSAQLKGLKFKAARKDGLPIKSIVHIPFMFELPEGPIEYNSVEDALQVSGKVEALDLSEKKLTKLDPRIGELQSLKKLNLDDNAFVKFPAVITKLQSLEELSITDNKLVAIPGSIKKMKNLKSLDIRGNELDEDAVDKLREMLEDVEILAD